MRGFKGILSVQVEKQDGQTEPPFLLQGVMPEEQGHTAHLCLAGSETLWVAQSVPWNQRHQECCCTALPELTYPRLVSSLH